MKEDGVLVAPVGEGGIEDKGGSEGRLFCV